MGRKMLMSVTMTSPLGPRTGGAKVSSEMAILRVRKTYMLI
jgi:hypothetical protein